MLECRVHLLKCRAVEGTKGRLLTAPSVFVLGGPAGSGSPVEAMASLAMGKRIRRSEERKP